MKEREKEGLVEQADRLESVTRENGKLVQKIAGLDGQVSARRDENRAAAVLACANRFAPLRTTVPGTHKM